ncbi:hypothetical protein PTSG_01404 [Salpingoeca rosetta]|uniref:Sulfotransferase n=1 Tax=Salpingoeca rosetta (strain ATCC 50818 / BSB-021) TaxID=946362 RepID=F2U090_SALR5|nr:uncharacterized protein PTSG_01404 [Salpingoeca rosetta]EGD80818.1 hypothetical protein PTSG_01404 [Salpingoeca rosetta]|eukprot:XP_004997379.1 hypothetical protein PTSG_01404 [Salpingoeca rosetta]
MTSGTRSRNSNESDSGKEPLFTFTPKHRFSTQNNFMLGVTLGPWLTVLWKYGYAIEWKHYWFRVLFLTFMACLNSTLSFLEWLFFRHRIRSAVINRRPVFILGHPRTGTTHLHNLISLDDDEFFAPTTLAAGFSAAYLLLHPVRHLLSGVLSDTRPMDNMALTFDVPQEDELSYTQSTPLLSMYSPLVFMTEEPKFRKYFRMQDVSQDEKKRYTDVMLAFLQKLAVHAQGRRFVLKSPTHTAKVRFLLELFPEAQFIYIHRHPYRVFRSAMNMADKTYWYSYLATPTNEQVAEFVMHQYEELFDAYMEDRSLIPEGNLVEVSFDELQQQPLQTMERIYTTLQWTGFDDRVKPKLQRYLKSLRGFKKNAFETLTDTQRQEVNRRWRKSFKAFGYTMQEKQGAVNIAGH